MGELECIPKISKRKNTQDLVIDCTLERKKRELRKNYSQFFSVEQWGMAIDVIHQAKETEADWSHGEGL